MPDLCLVVMPHGWSLTLGNNHGLNQSKTEGMAEQVAENHALGLPGGFVKYYEPKGEE